MAVYEIRTPIPVEDVRRLRVKDIIYISGLLFTLRDKAAERLAKLRPSDLPFPAEGLPAFHCGPIVRKVQDRWEIIAAGPTTSMRMEEFQSDIIRKFGLRVVIGKGGMGRRTAQAMEEYGAVYAAFTGGAALLPTKYIIRVVDVEWLDLGTPEALWLLEVKRFGPCLIGIDSKGGNLFADIEKKARGTVKCPSRSSQN